MANSKSKSDKIRKMRALLLDWYSRNRRDLPWRRNCDPYSVWISEIMLQQTRVAVVIERHRRFLKRFPTLRSLAEAQEQDVLAEWSGLGYYRRARMLHKAARLAVNRHNGKLPASCEELRLLPGIGAYTAAAIASIAHREPVAVVDGNVERVLCRFHGLETSSRSDQTAIRRKVEELAAELLDSSRPGDFNQAMMELGALVCLPRYPRCTECPLAAGCKTQGEHKTPPRPLMQKRKVAYALCLRHGRKSEPLDCRVLLEQRAVSQTVMPGLWELPVLPDPNVPDKALLMTLRHSIMQVNYTVLIRSVSTSRIAAITVPAGARHWVSLRQAAAMPLTGLTRKVLSQTQMLSSTRRRSNSPASE